MTSQETLEMKALDVSEGAWEDLMEEMFADDPDVMPPGFVGDAETEGPSLCCGSSCVTTCIRRFCSCGCACCGGGCC